MTCLSWTKTHWAYSLPVALSLQKLSCLGAYCILIELDQYDDIGCISVAVNTQQMLFSKSLDSNRLRTRQLRFGISTHFILIDSSSCFSNQSTARLPQKLLAGQSQHVTYRSAYRTVHCVHVCKMRIVISFVYWQQVFFSTRLVCISVRIIRLALQTHSMDGCAHAAFPGSCGIGTSTCLRRA